MNFATNKLLIHFIANFVPNMCQMLQMGSFCMQNLYGLGWHEGCRVTASLWQDCGNSWLIVANC
jgi:hypothetical protein